MREVILEKLRETEEKNGIRILLAVESGSRAWGLASPDSDYDVRFIYVRPEKEYLRLDKVRDVIELPVNEVLDINGWDLKKALGLLHMSNPALFEWLSSPIVYREDTELTDRFRALMPDHFISKKSLYHYVSMAEKNYKEFLLGDTVKAKKYFYVLRPVLACRWILEKGTPPPVLFSELAAAELPDGLKDTTDLLLDLKRNAPEGKEIPRIEALNGHLREEIDLIKARISAIAEKKDPDWDKLNRFFLSVLEQARI